MISQFNFFTIYLKNQTINPCYIVEFVIQPLLFHNYLIQESLEIFPSLLSMTRIKHRDLEQTSEFTSSVLQS